MLWYTSFCMLIPFPFSGVNSWEYSVAGFMVSECLTFIRSCHTFCTILHLSQQLIRARYFASSRTVDCIRVGVLFSSSFLSVLIGMLWYVIVALVCNSLKTSAYGRKRRTKEPLDESERGE